MTSLNRRLLLTKRPFQAKHAAPTTDDTDSLGCDAADVRGSRRRVRREEEAGFGGSEKSAEAAGT